METQIKMRFKYHAPTAKQKEKYRRLRDEAKSLAQMIDDFCPNSEEKATTIERLEESAMWANAAISRGR